MSHEDELTLQLATERAWAAMRGEVYADVLDLEVRWDPTAALPHLLTGSGRAFLAFYRDISDPDWDESWINVVDPADDTPVELALLEFVGYIAARVSPFGWEPPFAGLAGEGAYAIKNSRWIERGRHYLFAFPTETIEVAAADMLVEPAVESLHSLLSRALQRLLT
jgi:hypothetical protein